MNPIDQKHAFSLVVFAALISGISGILIKFMSIPTTSMAAVRSGTPVLVTGVYLVFVGRSIIKEGYQTMLGASVINTARMFLFFTAYIYTSIGNAVIVMYTWPIFATILSALILKEVITRNQVLLLILSFIGILVVYADKEFSLADRDFIGISAALGCAFCYALTIVIFKSKSKHYGPAETIFYQNLVPALLFLPFLLSSRPWPSNMDWALSLTHGVAIGVIMFLAFFSGLRHLNASRASMITYLEIISAMLLGYIFLGETLTTTTIIGGGIIIFATVVMRLSK
ncbi:MAG: DMT family transporter [Bacteroidota bacterium]